MKLESGIFSKVQHHYKRDIQNIQFVISWFAPAVGTIQIAFLMPPPLKVIAVANVATVNGVVA